VWGGGGGGGGGGGLAVIETSRKLAESIPDFVVGIFH